MRRFYLLCFFVTLLCTCVSAQINVTVSVDMTGISVDPTGVHLVGSFNGWDPTVTLMTETSPGSNIYEAVVNRPADDNIEYKVLNGNNYGGEEPTSPCSYEYNGNRVYTVPMADASLPTFAFGGCPPGVTRIPLTFRIDADGMDVSQGVYVVGEMTGFNNGGFTQMTQVGSSSVYEVTIMVPADLLKVNFKYALGPDFGTAETTTPAPCANPANADRFYRFTGGVEETAVYFFNTCDASIALPVELSHFIATAAAKSVFLEWSTLAEEDVDFFLVERSVDGQYFQAIGRVSAENTADGGQDYRFEDGLPESGINYYRLTTIDLDGTQQVEGIRTARYSETSDALSLYPNPVSGNLTVSFDGTAKLRVIDALGRAVFTTQATDTFNWSEAGALPTGRYFLQVETAAGVRQASFIKN